MSLIPSRETRWRLLLGLVCAVAPPLALMQSASADYVRTSNDDVQLRCTEPSGYELACDYLPLHTGEVRVVRAVIGDLELPAPSVTPLSAASSATAVMMLVDTSDPARAAAVAAARRHVRALVAAGRPRYQFALARFDSDLHVLAPLGSDSDAVLAAADRLEALGPTTELYRNALAAVKLLAEYPAGRRALLLFSDGLAEDSAYFHDDVVRAAASGGVAIYGLGYPRSVAQSVALQSLRRLAEETGGEFASADASLELPADFLSKPFAALDGGGKLRFDLAGAREQGIGGATSVDLTWATPGGESLLSVPVALPLLTPEPIVKVVEIEVPKLVEVPTVVEVPTLIEVPVKATPPPVVTTTPAASGEPRLAADRMPAARGWQWYTMLALALVVVLVLLLAMARLSRKQLAEPDTRTEGGDGESDGDGDGDGDGASAIGARTIGYLLAEDGMEDEHAITKPTYRIGRQADNDLSLTDPSISRHHAEIRRARDGSFSVMDLESMNGVFVNGKKARSAPLAHGDLLELGDVAMQFTVRAAEEEIPGEETVILRTVVPDGPLDGDNDMDDSRPLRHMP